MRSSSHLKILFVGVGSYVYGAENIILSVIRSFHQKGHTLFCAVSGWNDGKFIQQLNQSGVRYREIKLGWYYLTRLLWSLDSLVHAPSAYWQYFRLIKEFRPDVVYHYSYRTLFQLYPFLRTNNVYHVHDQISNGIGKKILQLTQKKVSCFIANSEFIKQDLMACGIAADKIKVVYNGISFDTLCQPHSAASNPEPQIGIIGQVSYRKGHLLLIEALGALKNKGYHFKLHIYGSGAPDFTEQVRNCIDQYQLASNVEWHGYVTDKEQMYRHLHFLVFPSLLPESFGLTIVEAGAYGKPAIAAAIGGVTEIVQQDITGLLFEPGNIDHLIHALSRLLNNSSEVIQMGQQARSIYANRFSEQRMNKELEHCFSTISS